MLEIAIQDRVSWVEFPVLVPNRGWKLAAGNCQQIPAKRRRTRPRNLRPETREYFQQSGSRPEQQLGIGHSGRWEMSALWNLAHGLESHDFTGPSLAVLETQLSQHRMKLRKPNGFEGTTRHLLGFGPLEP